MNARLGCTESGCSSSGITACSSGSACKSKIAATRVLGVPLVVDGLGVAMTNSLRFLRGATFNGGRPC
eukprot:1990495-Pyramimonas_sp.AAC.1